MDNSSDQTIDMSTEGRYFLSDKTFLNRRESSAFVIKKPGQIFRDLYEGLRPSWNRTNNLES